MFGSLPNRFKSALMCATLLSGGLMVAAPTMAQDSVTTTDEEGTVVVVTGFRASLRNATRAKKEATNFTETIFSEDIGKFPDLNMAEAMQRVPGMVVQRDGFSGDGTQISVRALPPSFTQVTLNGGRVAVASDFGFSGSSSPNRQVDLDMFPTGLFNRVDVSKTPSADTLEGGIAGTVNVQNARPFDRRGQHMVLAVQGSYNSNARETSPRITGVFSKTWDKFGVLVGYSATDKKIYTSGFETLGWGDANLSNFCTGCDPNATFSNGVATNPNGSNQFRFSNEIYGYTGNGLTPGALDLDGLMALNPGLSVDQIKGAKIPRLGRNSLLDGETNNQVGLIALEYRPTDDLRFNLDILTGTASRDATRTNMMWAVRNTGPGDDYNGGMIPIGMQVDANNVVTSGTFANSNFFQETNFYRDRSSFASINLGANWRLSDTLVLDGHLSYMRSTYERQVMFLKYRTPLGENVTATFENDSGNDIPTITSNVDLNDPNIGWRTFMGQLNLQRDRRSVNTVSAHFNATKDWGNWTFKGGWAYDEYARQINIYDNSAALVTAYENAITDTTVGQYLKPMSRSVYSGVSGAGFDRWVVPDLGMIAPVIGYDSLINARGNVTTGNSYNGAGASSITEKISSSFLMVYNTSTIFGVPVKSNFGYRFHETDQMITSPSNVNGQIVMITTQHKYKDALPSLNVVAQPNDRLNLRFAASKTMTRANPASMSSQLGFSDPSAQSASQGNPELLPFYSNNIDIGGEYYTGTTGYVGVTFFRKDIENFTRNSIGVVPFTSLGIPYDSLGVTQQNAIAVGLGTTADALLANPAPLAGWNINLSRPINSDSRLVLEGQEFMWVQPLDNLVEGLGFTANYTRFSFNDVSLAIGIPEYTFNVTGYYEHNGFSTHLSYVSVGQTTQGLMPSANSMPYNSYGADRHQVDLSASYKFRAFGFDQSITLDATNLTNQGFKNYIGFENITNTFQSPGTTILIGWRAQY